jgi:ribosomal protein S18 acetylase RimI-like enzyme
MDLRWLVPADVDTVVAAGHLFDDDVRVAWARHFLAQPNHHLCVAFVDGGPAGFVSGVELTHPDKGTEMFLYELGVDDRFQRRGIGRALVTALAERARQRGCYGMWVLTESDNEAALRTYQSAGAGERADAVMLTWHLAAPRH